MIISSKERAQLKAFWFARWISMCFADTFVGKERMEDGALEPLAYENGGMTVLNMEDGNWYAKQLIHFEETVYPNWLKTARMHDNLELKRTLEIIANAECEMEERKLKMKEDKWWLSTEIRRKEDAAVLRSMGL